jgi:hypothetical protein
MQARAKPLPHTATAKSGKLQAQSGRQNAPQTKPSAPATPVKTAQTGVRPHGWRKWLAKTVQYVANYPADSLVRGLLLVFAATLPLYYDLAVPEVSGDVRWLATSVFAGLGVVVLMVAALRRGSMSLTFRWPWHFWVALALVVWALVSFYGAMNPYRGIILWKALVAQLTLMALVYAVFTPKFGRQLVWALVLPVAFTSFLGIAQFNGWNDASFAEAVSHSGWFWTVPLWDALGWLTALVGPWLTNGWPTNQNPDLGFVGQITNYFLSSAIPGSTFANKNLAGSWTGMMLPLIVYLLLTSKTWRGQAVASGLLAIGAVFFVYARARASWIALTAGALLLVAVVVLVPAWRKAVLGHLTWRFGVWLLLPVLMLWQHGGAVAKVDAYAVNRTPAEQLEMLKDIANSWNEVGGRLAYNLNSVAIVRDNPINGVGLGNFFGIWPAYHDAFVPTPDNSYNVMARPQRTHTDLMQAFTEMGIPGGILYAMLFVLGMVAAFRLAGARAGALSGKVLGAGLGLTLLVVMLFLHVRNFVPLGGVWLVVLPGALGSLTVGLSAWALRDAWQLHCANRKSPTPAATDEQLMGLAAGLGVVTICINALMDFPMQLPTAPAATMMLLGLVTALAVRQGAMRYAPWGGASVWPRSAAAVGLGLVLLVWSVFVYDGLKFRDGNILLKAGMVRLFGGQVDTETRAILEEAQRVYPFDPRIQEHLTVVYANDPTLSLPESIAKLEAMLPSDAWAPNHLINLAGKYLQLADLLASQGNQAGAIQAVQRTNDLFIKLQRVAGFSHYTWGIGGMLFLIQGRSAEAAELFRKALAITPDYPPATQGLATAEQRLQAQATSGSARP